MNYPKNQLLENIKFRFLGRMREILAVHLERTNNPQKSAMNFRKLLILILGYLEGRKTYPTVQFVLKSDKKWICYSDFKKEVSSKNDLWPTWKMQFCNSANFRPRKSCLVSNCSVRRAKTSREIQIDVGSKTTELTHGNRFSLKKVSIIIFMQRSLWRDKLWAAML